MSSLFFAALRLCLLLTLVTGGLYPLLTTWLGQSFFAEQANGSLVSREGRVVGSALIDKIENAATPEQAVDGVLSLCAALAEGVRKARH